MKRIKKKVLKNKILSIDPSINYAGYAVFKGKRLVDYDLINKGSKMKSENYISKSKVVFGIICDLIKLHNISTIVIEVPEFFGSGGFLARESGSVFKLTFLCGMICSYENVVTYTPSGWKGQMPKNVTANLLQEHYTRIDFGKLDHNIADAIGIGHKYLHGAL